MSTNIDGPNQGIVNARRVEGKREGKKLIKITGMSDTAETLQVLLRKGSRERKIYKTFRGKWRIKRS